MLFPSTDTPNGKGITEGAGVVSLIGKHQAVGNPRLSLSVHSPDHLVYPNKPLCFYSALRGAFQTADKEKGFAENL